jgi:hypothetical protein
VRPVDWPVVLSDGGFAVAALLPTCRKVQPILPPPILASAIFGSKCRSAA